MRYVISNPSQTEWYVMWARGNGVEIKVSAHSSKDEADKACWPRY